MSGSVADPGAITPIASRSGSTEAGRRAAAVDDPRPLVLDNAVPPLLGNDDTPTYDPGADLRWLLLRPWVLFGRLIQVIAQLGWLALGLAIQANSRDSRVQKRLARRILTTLANLGPCFIKVGQALSTRPDLVQIGRAHV